MQTCQGARKITRSAEVLHTILGYGTERATMVIVTRQVTDSTGQWKGTRMFAFAALPISSAVEQLNGSRS